MSDARVEEHFRFHAVDLNILIYRLETLYCPAPTFFESVDTDSGNESLPRDGAPVRYREHLRHGVYDQLFLLRARQDGGAHV